MCCLTSIQIQKWNIWNLVIVTARICFLPVHLSLRVQPIAKAKWGRFIGNALCRVESQIPIPLPLSPQAVRSVWLLAAFSGINECSSAKNGFKCHAHLSGPLSFPRSWPSYFPLSCAYWCPQTDVLQLTPFFPFSSGIVCIPWVSCCGSTNTGLV